MFTAKTPRIGLAGVMCTPFRGDKEGNYQGDIRALEKLADELDFELLALPDGIYDLDLARSAARQLADWEADFVLLQTSSFASGDFLYPFTEISARLGLWSVPEGPPTAEGGLPLNSFTASNLYNSIVRTTLLDYQKPVKWFLGHPGQPYFDQRLEITVQALRALINLPGKKVALIGGVAPSFDNLIIDYQRLKSCLEIDVLEFDLGRILGLARELQDPKLEKTMQAIKSPAKDWDDQHEIALEKTARLHLAVQKLAEEHGFEAVALSCWPQLQDDYGMAACSMMGHLNTVGLIAACEGDLTSAVSMLALRYLSGGDVVTLMDLVSIDSNDDSVLLWHCGPTSPALADENGVRMQPLWLFDGPEGQRTGLHNDLVLRPGAGTVLGFTTDFDRMLVLDGVIDNTKSSYVGSRGWLTQLHLNAETVSTQELVQTLMYSGYQHHYPFCFGNLSLAGLEFCGWLGIQPIAKETYTPYVR